jgi:hypothetical protein
MKLTKLISIFLLCVMTTTGCSAFRSSTQTITVTTDQPDTEIYVNGTMAGKGTANMAVKRNQNVSILAKKDGYIPVNRTIGKSLNTTGILDIVGGILILLPIFGLLAPGAYSLDEENITIMMIKA